MHQNGYLTDLMGDRAVKVIGDYAKARQPFLLSLHFNAPHWPWEGPGRRGGIAAHQSRWSIATAARMKPMRRWSRAWTCRWAAC